VIDGKNVPSERGDGGGAERWMERKIGETNQGGTITYLGGEDLAPVVPRSAIGGCTTSQDDWLTLPAHRICRSRRRNSAAREFL
jgi:hypothetical protein